MRHSAALAVLLLASPAAAEETIRLGDTLAFSPYVLGQLDMASFAQSREGGQAAGLNLRRMRLGGRLNVADQVQFGFIWDFASLPGEDGTLFEAKAAYTGFKPFTATVGVFKTNFSLESMQSAGGYLMLERASIVTITRNLAAGIRRQGLELQADGDRYNASVALTAGRAGPGRDGDQRAVVARAAGLAVHTDALALHLGVSGEYVIRAASNLGQAPAFSLSDQTEIAVDDVSPALSTGRLQARSGGALGPELGLAWRRLWLQGEYYGVLVNRQAAAGGALRFDGWYAQAAYTVLGTPRQWDHKIGAWGAPRPGGRFDPKAGQFGAVEVGVRYATVDLNDRDLRGGRQHVASLAVNWWPIEPLRFTAMAEHAEVTDTPRARRLNAVAGRAQLQF